MKHSGSASIQVNEYYPSWQAKWDWAGASQRCETFKMNKRLLMWHFLSFISLYFSTSSPQLGQAFLATPSEAAVHGRHVLCDPVKTGVCIGVWIMNVCELRGKKRGGEM